MPVTHTQPGKRDPARYQDRGSAGNRHYDGAVTLQRPAGTADVAAGNDIGDHCQAHARQCPEQSNQERQRSRRRCAYR